MIKGELKTAMEYRSTQPMSPIISGMSVGHMSHMVEEVSISPHWEESTGVKKGLIIKRVEKRKLQLESFRCKNCGFIELYALKK